MGAPAEAQEVVPALQLVTGFFQYYLIALGLLAIIALPILIGFEAYVFFFKESASPEVKATARGNIGTYLIALAAVIGIVGWADKSSKPRSRDPRKST